VVRVIDVRHERSVIPQPVPRNSTGRGWARRALSCAATWCSALIATHGIAACASAPPRQANLDAAFARIQVAEARIEHARADVARPDNDCKQCDAASEQARSAQNELCGTAREIADADALVRCEQAERSAASIALQAQRRCAAPSGVAPSEGHVMEAR
jgi:hypothetical protein